MKKLILLTIVTLCANIVNAQWQQTSATSNISFKCIVSDGTNIFAGGSGVFLSTNNGSTWAAVNTGLPNAYVISLAISGTNIFAGASNGGGVFLSTNNGSTWAAVNTGLPLGYSFAVNSIAISGTNIFAGTSAGVYLSNNNGSTWSAVNTGLPTYGILCLAISGTNIFAGTDGGGLFLSTNNGSTWAAVNTGVFQYDGVVHSLAISGTNIFAGSSVETYSAHVFLSTDNGSTWATAFQSLPYSGYNVYVNSFAISGTNIFAANDAGVYLSTNNGSSWTDVSNGLDSDGSIHLNSLAIIGTNIFALSTYNGIWKRPLSETVGIEETNYNTHYMLYPNPSIGKFNIEIDNKETNKINLEIYNLLGERIFVITNLKWQTSNEIDLSNSPKGIYFAKICEGEKIYIEKIVIQ